MDLSSASFWRNVLAQLANGLLPEQELGVLGGPWGGPRWHQKRRWISGGVLGQSWVALGVFLEVWGDPWVSPEMSKGCPFVGFRRFSDMSCFLMIFHRYLEAMLFSQKTKNHVVFTSILGGHNVAISLVLAMIMEISVFPQVRFQ